MFVEDGFFSFSFDLVAVLGKWSKLLDLNLFRKSRRLKLFVPDVAALLSLLDADGDGMRLGAADTEMGSRKCDLRCLFSAIEMDSLLAGESLTKRLDLASLEWLKKEESVGCSASDTVLVALSLVDEADNGNGDAFAAVVLVVVVF